MELLFTIPFFVTVIIFLALRIRLYLIDRKEQAKILENPTCANCIFLSRFERKCKSPVPIWATWNAMDRTVYPTNTAKYCEAFKLDYTKD